mgnify:CR=1 FL=1
MTRYFFEWWSRGDHPLKFVEKIVGVDVWIYFIDVLMRVVVKLLLLLENYKFDT